MFRRNSGRIDQELVSVSPTGHEERPLAQSLLFAVVDTAHCHPRTIGKYLCQSVTEITAHHAYLSLHLSSVTCPEPYETGSLRYPVQYEHYSYGTLCIALNAHTHLPCLSSSVAEQLAKTCGIIIDRVEKDTFVRYQAHHPWIEPLTMRERDVLMHMGHGYTQGEIARLLHISPTTVATHRQHIYAKWGLNSPLSAVLMGHEIGLFFYLADTP
ncbi:response regulator transcription factor [Ktedonosporobacter rubrisoli]|nr:LuxR C-terminal-related transcriptional regulator [Ktedonosporobacter rubrisoli]